MITLAAYVEKNRMVRKQGDQLEHTTVQVRDRGRPNRAVAVEEGGINGVLFCVFKMGLLETTLRIERN